MWLWIIMNYYAILFRSSALVNTNETYANILIKLKQHISNLWNKQVPFFNSYCSHGLEVYNTDQAK